MRRAAAAAWLGVAIAVLCAPLAGAPAGEPRAADWIEPRTGMPFVLIHAGRFLMGSPAGEPGRGADETLHEVRLSRPFYIGRYEVTQGQWEAVMGDNPSRFRDCGADCPVETVSADAIARFLERLAPASGPPLRLPTEAEWEYACRAGTSGPFSTGGTLTAGQANIDGRTPYNGAPESGYRASPTPVGSYPANPWGLFDMHGNVWEWCQDRYCPYPRGPVTDPLGDCDEPRLVIRGGSWYFGPDSARSALRYTHLPVDDGPSLGFRLARDAEPGAGIEDLSWLAGCWKRTVRGGVSQERWSGPLGGIMLGYGRTVVNGRATSWELLRIEEREGRLVYTAIPSGQSETSFRELRRAGDRIVFENPEHDFPQRIAYKRRPDGSLFAWIEGPGEGSPKRVEFAFEAEDCEAP